MVLEFCSGHLYIYVAIQLKLRWLLLGQSFSIAMLNPSHTAGKACMLGPSKASIHAPRDGLQKAF